MVLYSTCIFCRTVAVHQLTDAPDVNVYRAEAHASAATHTLNADIIFIDVIFELVHKSLADPVQFGVSGIMSGTMQGKKRVHAAVPVAHANAAVAAVFILDIKTPAGWAHIGAGAAINARKRNVFPKWGIVEFGGIRFSEPVAVDR